jgi:POT family proton-dependent oligopeptide transporter
MFNLQKIQDQSHSKDAYLFVISKLLERLAYYGLRSILLLYMISELLRMSKQEASMVYGWFTFSIVVSSIIGALLGDLVIGNKKSVILGCLLQAFGAFSLCIAMDFGLYIGLFLIVIGNGLYTPNLFSIFGKQYLKKPQLLYPAFSILYLGINIGAFLGALLIGYIRIKWGWDPAFITLGVIILISSIPIILSKEQNKFERVKSKSVLAFNKKVFIVLGVVFLMTICFIIRDFSDMRMHDLKQELSQFLPVQIPFSFWSSLDTILMLPISIILIVWWSKYYSSLLIKLIIGLMSIAVFCALILIIPNYPADKQVLLYVISVFFITLSKLYFAPIINAVLVKYTNPNYIAIFISLAFIPLNLLSFAVFNVNEVFYENPTLALKTSLIATLILILGLIIYYYKTQKRELNSN